jgi:hypothetical protein
VDLAIGDAAKRDVGGRDGIADAVAAEGAVHFFGQDVARGGIVFCLGGRANGKTATFMTISVGVGEPRIMAMRMV